MSEDRSSILRAVLVLILIFAVSFVVYLWGYKEGQIDAIRGEIKYELVEQINGEMRWERIKMED